MYDEQGIKSRIEAATVHQLTLTEEASGVPHSCVSMRTQILPT